MREQIKRGDKVVWQVNNETKTGYVVDTYLQSGNSNSSHTNIYNMASKNALLIELADGSKVMKLENEVKRG